MNMLTSLKSLLRPGIAPASARSGDPATGDGPDFATLMQDSRTLSPPSAAKGSSNPSPAQPAPAEPASPAFESSALPVSVHPAPPASAPLPSPPQGAADAVPAAPLGVPAPAPRGSLPSAEDAAIAAPSETSPQQVSVAPLPLPSAPSGQAPAAADAPPVKQGRPARLPEAAPATPALPPADDDIPAAEASSHEMEGETAKTPAVDATVTGPASPFAPAPIPVAVAPPIVVAQTPQPSPAIAGMEASTSPVTGAARPAAIMAQAPAMPPVETPRGPSVGEQPTLAPSLPAARAPVANGASQPLSPDTPLPVMVAASTETPPSAPVLPVAVAPSAPIPPKATQSVPLPNAVADPAASEALDQARPAPSPEASEIAALPRRSMTEVMSLLQLARDQLHKREGDAGTSVADRAIDMPARSHATPEAVPTPPILSPAAAPPSPVQAMTALPTVDLSATLGAQVVDMGVSGQWIDGLARDIARFSADGARSHFQIDAGRLGPVQVDIRQSADGAAVSLTVASDIAEQALRQESDRLRGDPALSAVRIADMKIERGHVVAEASRTDSGNHPGSQQSSGQQGQGGWTAQGQQQGWSQSSAQSQMQGRGQGRDNFGSGAKAQGDAVVLHSEQVGVNAADLPRARYA